MLNGLHGMLVLLERMTIPYLNAVGHVIVLLLSRKAGNGSLCKTATLKKTKKMVFKTNCRLIQVKSVTELGALCNTFDLH